jgi:hypothetical protein
MLSSTEARMLRTAMFVTLALVGLYGRASAGVLSAADVQRIEAYERFVRPAAQEVPTLREMEAKVGALIAAAESAPEPPALRFGLHDLPRIGGQGLEQMVSVLQAIDDPATFAPSDWTALLGEVKAEIEERLAYDARLMSAYQRSVATGGPGLGPSLVDWEARPGATHHWSRFQAILDRAS